MYLEIKKADERLLMDTVVSDTYFLMHALLDSKLDIRIYVLFKKNIVLCMLVNFLTCSKIDL